MRIDLSFTALRDCNLVSISLNSIYHMSLALYHFQQLEGLILLGILQHSVAAAKVTMFPLFLMFYHFFKAVRRCLTHIHAAHLSFKLYYL